MTLGIANAKVTVVRQAPNRNPDPYGRKGATYSVVVSDGYSANGFAYTSHHEQLDGVPLEACIESAVTRHFMRQAQHRILAWQAGR